MLLVLLVVDNPPVELVPLVVPVGVAVAVAVAVAVGAGKGVGVGQKLFVGLGGGVGMGGGGGAVTTLTVVFLVGVRVAEGRASVALLVAGAVALANTVVLPVVAWLDGPAVMMSRLIASSTMQSAASPAASKRLRRDDGRRCARRATMVRMASIRLFPD